MSPTSLGAVLLLVLKCPTTVLLLRTTALLMTMMRVGLVAATTLRLVCPPLSMITLPEVLEVAWVAAEAVTKTPLPQPTTTILLVAGPKSNVLLMLVFMVVEHCPDEADLVLQR